MFARSTNVLFFCACLAQVALALPAPAVCRSYLACVSVCRRYLSAVLTLTYVQQNKVSVRDIEGQEPEPAICYPPIQPNCY